MILEIISVKQQLSVLNIIAITIQVDTYEIFSIYKITEKLSHAFNFGSFPWVVPATVRFFLPVSRFPIVERGRWEDAPKLNFLIFHPSGPDPAPKMHFRYWMNKINHTRCKAFFFLSCCKPSSKSSSLFGKWLEIYVFGEWRIDSDHEWLPVAKTGSTSRRCRHFTHLDNFTLEFGETRPAIFQPLARGPN